MEAIDQVKTMGNTNQVSLFLRGKLKRCTAMRSNSGQAVVEFTLIFLLLLIITWIPAEFGLAFYAGQVAQNAAREGARIAAADPNPVAGTCGPPVSSCYGGANILKETSLRLPAALMSGITVTLAVDTPSSTDCNEKVTVTVTGQYRFFFYQLFKLLGATINDTRQITRSTAMRWENQPGCAPIP